MRGGKVQPSDDNERQAEQENDDFAAPCHSGERSLTCLGASKKPKSRTSRLFVFNWLRKGPGLDKETLCLLNRRPKV
jgi:hypothetical protein